MGTMSQPKNYISQVGVNINKYRKQVIHVILTIYSSYIIDGIFINVIFINMTWVSWLSSFDCLEFIFRYCTTYFSLIGYKASQDELKTFMNSALYYIIYATVLSVNL